MTEEGVVFPQIIVFGDSLTQYGFSEDGCWLSVLADRLQRRCDIIQRGFSGYNTTWCRQILPSLYSDRNSVKNVAAFIFFLGANDSNRPNTTGQDVSVELFQQNLEAMIQHLVERCELLPERILLLTLPPCVDEAWQAQCLNLNIICGKFLVDCAGYAEAATLIATKHHVTCVDVYEHFIKQEDWQKRFFCDGLHFSADGSKVLANMVWPHIEKQLTDLPMLFPDWKDMLTNSNTTQVVQNWLKNYRDC